MSQGCRWEMTASSMVWQAPSATQKQLLPPPQLSLAMERTTAYTQCVGPQIPYHASLYIAPTTLNVYWIYFVPSHPKYSPMLCCIPLWPETYLAHHRSTAPCTDSSPLHPNLD